MSPSSSFPERLQRAFNPTHGGVVGVVDELLLLCCAHAIRLDWQADQCQIRQLGIGPQELIQIPLPKAVLRAILARLAALCNEQKSQCVSPYGGEGKLAVDSNPPTVCHVAFKNTPGEQWLVLGGSIPESERARAENASGSPNIINQDSAPVTAE
jgi:hypothetical protein